MYVLLCAFILCAVVYYYLRNELNYWKIRDVPYEKGSILVGNFGASLLMTKAVTDIYSDIYKKFEGYKYCGIFQFRNPTLLILDPDFAKNILIKNFNNFHDSPFIVDEKQDPIISKNPFFATGEKWKKTRAQLTPQFTSGKIKEMFPLLNEVGKKLVEYLNEEADAREEKGLNAKDLACKFTADAVASCAFGLDGRSFVDPKTEFIELGKAIMSSTYFDTILFFLILIFPESQKIKIPKFISDDVAERFKHIILENLKNREINGIRRGDFLDTIADMQKTTTSFDYNFDYILAHALSFFLDGFETSAIVLQFVYYELGANVDVQDKLRDEIEETLQGDDENFNYDTLQEMKYLDMVIQETLRKYPPLTALARKCTETTILEPAKVGGTPVVIEKDIQIIIPIMAMHYDPKYYDDPDKFDPERFSEKSKELKQKRVYLPFGEGPRMCLGRRFGVTQIKVATVATLRKFKIRVNKKTKIPFKLDPVDFFHSVIGGVWINFYKLVETNA